jgi:Bacteriocin-protection, YdeI or OmpD-Associated
MDRRTEAAQRQTILAADIHPAATEKWMVQEEHRTCRTPHRVGQNGGCRAEGNRRRKGRRPLASRYDSFGTAAIPDDFLKRLAANKKATAFFATLNKTNLYSIAYRLQTAKKPETRDKRIQAIIEKLARGEKFH